MARDSWLKSLIWLRGSPAGGSGSSYEKTVGPAPIISISDAKAKPAKSLVVGMEPIQAGSGDPSPDNIRPITGRTGVTVWRTGVNVWDEEVSVVGSHINSKNNIPVLPNTEYAWVSTAQPANGFWFKDADGNTISTIYAINTGKFTTPANCRYVAFALASAYGTTYNHDISINYPATDTDYHAYTGQSYPVTWQSEAGTVYGCTVDVVSGVLTVDRAYALLNNPDKWISTSGTADFRYDVYIGGRKIYSDSYSGIMCSYVPCAYGAEPYGRWNSASGYYFCIKSSAITLDQVKADASAWNIAICYELATPQTYQLTPQQIQLLKGANVLWSDADDLTLTYIGTTPPNLLGGMLGGGLGGGYNPPAEQDPEELTEPEATETDEPADETPAEEGENNGE